MNTPLSESMPNAMNPQTLAESPRWHSPSRLLAFLLATLVGITVFASGSAPASGAPQAVSSITVTVAQDGTQPLNPAYDDSLNNDKVATNDRIQWTVQSVVATAGAITYTSTFPADQAGMQWDPSSIAPTICDVSGSISPDGRTWTCTRTASTGTESFAIAAWVGAVADGTVVSPTVSSDAVSGTAPGVTVVGASRTELRVYSTDFTQTATFDNQAGASFRLLTYPGITAADGNLRGAQSFQTPLTYSISVPPNAQVMSYAMNAGSGGTIQVTQAAPGADVQVTLTGIENSFLKAAQVTTQPTSFYALPSVSSIVIFIPNDPTLPVGQATTVTTQVTDFDPAGQDGSSNFGAGFAPGQDPGYSCPPAPAVSSQLACAVWVVDRTNAYVIIGNTVGVVSGPATGAALLIGDNHPFSQGAEKVVPGAAFGMHFGFGNRSDAQSSATVPRACVVFDPALLSLSGTPIVRQAGNPGPGNATYSGQGVALDPSQYTIEYSAVAYATDNERRGTDCGVAGDGATGWVSDPANLPGGMGSVTSIRVSSTLELAPAVSLGISVPFTRTLQSSSLPVNAAIPAFFQYGTHETGLVTSAFPSAGSSAARSDGGYIQAVPSLVRTLSAVDTPSIAPGSSTTLRLSPFVIAPVGDGVTTTADDVTLSVSLQSTCASPTEASLKALVDAGTIASYDLTPADPGPDGILCTADDGVPAHFVLHLGDLPAPGGPSDLSAPGYTGRSGHQITLPQLAIDFVSSPLTPSGTQITAQTVIAAATDTSPADASPNTTTDRTVTSTIVVTGVASLGATKAAATQTAGYLGSGEIFSYTLDWFNGTNDRTGPGTFVDVLPFDGDARGTVGLGSGGFTVEDVTASMTNTSVMGDVAIQYTTDPAPAVEAAITQNGNEDGATGIAWHTGTVPSTGVTALRFVMSDDLAPGFSGTATITLKAPSLAVGGKFVNDMHGRTGAVDGNPDTAHAFRGVSPVTLLSSSAGIAGTVYRDLDFSGTVTAADDTWPAGTGIVEIVDATTGDVVATADLTADGTYSAVVAPGTYSARLNGGVHDGWAQVAPGSVTLAAGDDATGFDQLYAEVIADPELVDDSASTDIGASVVIDVTANDTLQLPTVSQGAFPRDGVGLGPVAPTYGTVELTASDPGSEQSQIRYTAPAEWPAAFAGRTAFDDTFTYTWTNALGVTKTATVTVTVHAGVTPPVFQPAPPGPSQPLPPATGPSGSPGGDLAQTGSDILATLGLGLLAFATGIVLVARRRRPRRA